MSDATAAPLPSSLISTCLALASQLVTHHGKGHELQDVSASPLLQALDALLHKTLHKLGVWSRHLGAHDGGNEEEKVG